MGEDRRYTTQLQAGLGMIPEAMDLLRLWEPGMIPDLADLVGGQVGGIAEAGLSHPTGSAQALHLAPTLWR